MRATLLGTHNSAISQAYRFGIEEDFIFNLTGERMYRGDDLGEGVCQTLSVTDQLRMGLRHIEIDITSGYFKAFEPRLPKVDEIFVCHSPFPLDPQLVNEVRRAAKAKGVSLDGFEAKNLSCEGTHVPLAAMLREIKAWMDRPENADEVVMVYYDTKPLTVDLPSQATAIYSSMIDVFGEEHIWKVADGDPLAKSADELVKAGKRIIFEDHDKGYNHPSKGDVLVFASDLWKKQFGASSLAAFPNCSIGGDDGWYGNEFVRALSTAESFGPAAMRCAVNIVSPDYIMPGDMTQYVWTFGSLADMGRPGDCVMRARAGGWRASPCSAAKLAVACQNATDDRHWSLSAPLSGDAAPTAQCPRGFLPQAPTNGYADALLGLVIGGKQDVWLNVKV